VTSRSYMINDDQARKIAAAGRLGYYLNQILRQHGDGSLVVEFDKPFDDLSKRTVVIDTEGHARPLKQGAGLV
jgi:hypothetical protein